MVSTLPLNAFSGIDQYGFTAQSKQRGGGIPSRRRHSRTRSQKGHRHARVSTLVELQFGSFQTASNAVSYVNGRRIFGIVKLGRVVDGSQKFPFLIGDGFLRKKAGKTTSGSGERSPSPGCQRYDASTKQSSGGRHHIGSDHRLRCCSYGSTDAPRL